MVVQHNLQAMNANRMLGITSANVAGSTEKLSSGYKINRAADDAAGLSISEKMRKQIRGLDQASSNAEDGISSVQTAEGALAEVQDMLQRMNELAVQAANGTNSKTDRQYIQDEIDQLVTEIDRVAETTKFNDTYLLKGDETKGTNKTYIMDYSVSYTVNQVSNATSNANALTTKVNYTGSNNVYMVDDSILTTDSSVAMSADKIGTGDDITKYMVKDVTTTTTVPMSATYVSGDPVSTIALKAGSTIGTWYAADSSTAVADISDLKNYIEIKEDGTIGYIDGKMLYSVAASTIGASTGAQTVQSTDTQVPIATIQNILQITTTGLYKDNAGTAVATDDELESHFDAYGVYKGGLYQYDTVSGNIAEVGADEIGTYVTVTPTAQATNANSSAAAFNSASYVAFVAIELDSTVATGANGSVEGKTGDLSTDGITDTVRANKDLYIYKRDTGTVTHLHAGDDMTAYLNDDNTMKDDYALLGILDSSSGTDTAVKNQMLGGKSFVWDNNYIEKASSKKQLYDVDGNEVSGMALYKYFDENGNYTGGLYTTAQARVIDQVFAEGAKNTTAYKNVSAALASGEAAIINDYINISSTEVSEDLSFDLHVGADSARENKITVDITSLTSAGLGIDKLHSSNIGIVDETGANATDAIDVIAEALQRVSTQRSALGAVQNRLEHTIKNLDNIVENTTSAESAIRDTDMADEMVAYSNNNVLQQAGQSMLAQANQANQGILSLLQ